MAAVLIVEDDPELGDVLASLLEDAGHDVAVASSLEDARNALEGATPSVVLADWNVPGGGAPELLRVLAEERLRVPIIAMTGLDVNGLDRRGFAAVIAKPFTTDRLLGLISSLVDEEARAPA
jgi:DNA-binding response OmpR family regulator